MWLLQWFPSWFFSLLFFLGIVGYLASKTFRIFPGLTWIAQCVVAFSLFMIGAKTADDSWRQKVVALEKQVLELEAQSQKTNTEVVTKVITKREVIRERGQDVVKYIDREIVKLDQSCKLPPELLEAHNKAAKK